MTLGAIAVIAAVLVVLLAAAAWWAWRRQAESQGLDLPQPPDVPHGFSPTLLDIEASYVATTRGSDPLARVMAHGLGFRATGSIAAGAEGVAVVRDGSRDLFIPKESLLGAEPAATAIDRGVERDGLVAIVWRLGEEQVVTTIRPRYAADRDRILQVIGRLSADRIEKTK